MSSVLLVKTAVADGEVAPQVLCDRGWLIAPQEHWHHLLRVVLLLGVRQLFLEEIYNHSIRLGLLCTYDSIFEGLVRS